MSLIINLQSAAPPSLAIQLTLVAVMVATFVVVWFASRRLRRGLRQSLVTNKSRTNLIFSIICILWGGAVWFLIISSKRYDNVLAIVMASILVCMGVYSLIKALLKST